MFGDSVFVDTYPVIILLLHFLFCNLNFLYVLNVARLNFARIFIRGSLSWRFFFTIAKNAGKLRTKRVIRLI